MNEASNQDTPHSPTATAPNAARLRRPRTTSRPTRRTVVRGAGVAAAVAASGPALAQSTTSTTPAGSHTALSTAQRAHISLLGRASFGYTAKSAAEIARLGPTRWVDWQLNPSTIDDSVLDAKLGQFDWLHWSAHAMIHHPTKEEWEIGHEGRAARLLRATYSERQLFERLVEFWTDHFNIYGSGDDTWVLKVADDRDVIRAHALGSFRDLLHASAKSPAMLAYLDNDSNVVGAAQENYAREVMELHTLGVDGPYTEDDVRELARCFTGWGYVKWWQPGQYGTFVFRPADHDYGAKSVLGLSIPAGGGLSDAETVLDHLASHPKTIDFVTTKLANWFLGYDAPQSVIDRGKAAWTATNGEIKEVVRALLSLSSLRVAGLWNRKKLKRPFHWIVSLYRATGAELEDPSNTVWAVWGLGQVPFQWKAPNGYPDVAAAWASNLIPRWRHAALYGNGWYWPLPHTVQEMRDLLAGAPKAIWARRVAEILAGGDLEPSDLATVQTYLDTFPSETDQAVGEAFELVACAPSFQLY